MVSVPSIGVVGKSALKIGQFLRRNLWMISGGPISLPAPLFIADIVSGLQKGPAERATSKNVKNRQKASKSFSTLSDNFCAGQKRSKSSKSVKKFFDTFRQFSRGTILSRPLSGVVADIGVPEWRFRGNMKLMLLSSGDVYWCFFSPPIRCFYCSKLRAPNRAIWCDCDLRFDSRIANH